MHLIGKICFAIVDASVTFVGFLVLESCVVN